MDLVLPPDVTSAQFAAATSAFASVVGSQWVLTSDADRESYTDSYALGDGRNHAPSGAVAPGSVDEVRALIRLANEHKMPLSPISRGKNLGYGQSSPALPGTMVLDLSRLNCVLEVDAKTGTALLEPGVSFFDLYNHLKDQDIPLWMSVPGNAWGSVLGNALERGMGYSPYGDHVEQLCGLEVVLPDGDLMRTGMGAMAGNKTWQNYKYGFGPAWDQLFVQSSFGIVTKGGLWLQPEPEMSAKVMIHLPKFEDIGWAIDVLAELRRQDVIQHNIVFGNYLHDAAVWAQRKEWYDGPGAIPDEVSQQIIDKHKIGWWSIMLRLYGHEARVEADMALLRKVLEPRLGKPLEFTTWRKGEPIEQSARGIPSVLALHIVNWHGGRGGHIGFSPAMPPDGALAFAQAKRMKARFEEFGLDYYTSFTMGQRHINNVNLILYNRDDDDMVNRAKGLFTTLIGDAKEQGYAEYRTHPEFMQPVVDTFDFNNHALARLNGRVKAALDPNNIIAPGRYGIVPNTAKQEEGA